MRALGGGGRCPACTRRCGLSAPVALEHTAGRTCLSQQPRHHADCREPQRTCYGLRVRLARLHCDHHVCLPLAEEIEAEGPENSRVEKRAQNHPAPGPHSGGGQRRDELIARAAAEAHGAAARRTPAESGGKCAQPRGGLLAGAWRVAPAGAHKTPRGRRLSETVASIAKTAIREQRKPRATPADPNHAREKIRAGRTLKWP